MAKGWLEGLGEAVKGAFVEYKEVPDAPGEEKPAVSAPTPSPVGPKATPAPATSVADPGLMKTLDESAKKQLLDAIEASGAALVEELTDIIETLKESIDDEGALYKAALKLLGKKGHSTTDLLGDYDKCLGVIEKKDREFEAQLKGQIDKRIGARAREIEGYESQIAAKKAQVDQLQQEIADLAIKKQEAQGSVTEEQQKLELAQDRFTRVYQAIRAEVESQRAKITQYGGKV